MRSIEVDAVPQAVAARGLAFLHAAEIGEWIVLGSIERNDAAR
jgi:hypothetical protein